jgi:CheY-like chemotaxis protein
VEDSPTDAFVIKEILAGADLKFHVDVVKDGQEALRYLLRSGGSGYGTENCPALVLLDLNIPKVSGLEVLAELRAGPICQSVPVIVVSSSRAEEDHDKAKRLGADAYFEKPSDLQSYTQLARIVELVLRRRGAGE